MSKLTIALLFVVFAQIAFSQLQLAGEENLVIRAKRAELEASGEGSGESSGEVAHEASGESVVSEGSGTEGSGEAPNVTESSLLADVAKGQDKKSKPAEEIAA